MNKLPIGCRVKVVSVANNDAFKLRGDGLYEHKVNSVCMNIDMQGMVGKVYTINEYSNTGYRLKGLHQNWLSEMLVRVGTIKIGGKLC